jgi:hypothetical protein
MTMLVVEDFDDARAFIRTRPELVSLTSWRPTRISRRTFFQRGDKEGGQHLNKEESVQCLQ